MDINTIYKILDSFANNGKVFSNEQDFQFEFAKALDSLSEVVEVKLEVLSLTIDWQSAQQLEDKKGKINKDKKEYTDIIVKLKNDEYIGIELKFKTPNKICYYHTPQSGNVLTLAQDAHNINAYAFIEDIHRLEDINGRHFYKNFKISKGYAILLTNNFHYRFNDFSQSSIWMNYAINEGRVIPQSSLTFENGNRNHNFSKTTYNAIQLKKSYKLEWKDYKLNGYNDYQDKNRSAHPGFSYLVVEVHP